MRTRFLSFLLLPSIALAGGFSNLNVSARAISLGGTLVCFADDPNVLFYNPAGIAAMRGVSLSTSYSQLFPGIADDQLRLFSGSAVANLGFVGNFGFGIKSFSANNWREQEFIGSYAQEFFDFLLVGGSAKMLYWSSGEPQGRSPDPEPGMSKTTISFDVGAEIEMRDILPSNDLRVGVMMGDINQPSTAISDSLKSPLDVRLLGAVAFISRTYDYDVVLHYSFSGNLRSKTASGNNVAYVGVGTEITAIKSTVADIPFELVFRFGGTTTQLSGINGDVSGGLGLMVGTLHIDYAYGQPGELFYVGGTHHLSLRYSF